MKSNSNIVFLSYVVALVCLYPVTAHIAMYQFGYMQDKLPHGPLWLYVQIFLSGPFLIIVGLLLYFKFGQLFVNKIFGATFCIVGLCWLYVIVTDIIKEAA